MTERPRPKRRHKKLSNKRQSVPNHLTNRSKRKKDIELKRPRPSLTLKRSQHSNPTKPINLIQSISNESKESKISVYDQEKKSCEEYNDSNNNSPNLSPNNSNNNSPFHSSKKEELLQKLQQLDNISKNQSSRKAKNDLDEIKQFINNNNPSMNTASSFTKDDQKYKQLTHSLNKSGGNKFKRDTLPTSLKLIGIRDPKSLLYHRQYGANNFGVGGVHHQNHQHHRTQSSITTTNAYNNNNNNTMLTKQPSIINKGKYSHLRSFSSIMGPSNQQIQQSQNRILKNDGSSSPTKHESTTEYVQGVKSRKPSHIFGPNTSKPSQIATTLKELADEYSSSSDDSDNDDDDIKEDK
mmetsp:Transcript_43955/g.39184  ORF Transcript_43955/g.39184 Transcript_43955/m.39184 type:complete len:352 (+) Transcript_43955:28-1083(+)